MKQVIFIVSFLISLVNFGQNLTRFSQFNFAKSIYNPAALGADASITADLIYRNQWNGIDGAPQTFAFNGSYDLSDDMAIGLSFSNDRIGLNQTNSLSAMYSYRLIFDERKYLSFGVGLGADNTVAGFGDANTIEQGDPAFSGSISRFNLNASFGVYFRTSRFYTGVSIPELFQNKLSGADQGFKPPRWHYLAIAGYYFELNDNFILTPSVQLKYTLNSPLQGDVLLRGIYTNFGATIGYRTENSLIFGVDYMIKDRVRIGYMFNHDVGLLARAKGMSHEVYLGLGLPYYFNKNSGTKYLGKKGSYAKGYRRAARRQNVRR
jgi:type IX secretion system PorP/SprF family membrane protein